MIVRTLPGAARPLVGRQSRLGSGGSLVDMVQTSEDRPRDRLPFNRTMTRHRSLKTERSMRSILVVVGHELGQVSRSRNRAGASCPPSRSSRSLRLSAHSRPLAGNWSVRPTP
jgi:hypothetical protein